MYVAGSGIKPWRAARAGGPTFGRRAVVVAAVVMLTSVGMAVAARGGAPPADTTVVVQPGDTLWSIAAAHYPGDDVRVRIEDIEQANGLGGPTIEVGQTLKLPG